MGGDQLSLWFMFNNTHIEEVGDIKYINSQINFVIGYL